MIAFLEYVSNYPDYCTVTVAVAVVRPNWFVVYRVYVVVADGLTTMLVPRTGPAWGSMMLYSLFDTLQLKVTGCPAIEAMLTQRFRWPT